MSGVVAPQAWWGQRCTDFFGECNTSLLPALCKFSVTHADNSLAVLQAMLKSTAVLTCVPAMMQQQAAFCGNTAVQASIPIRQF